MDEGIVPVKRFFPTPNDHIDVILPIEFGNVPENLLLFIVIEIKFEQFPIDSGNEPVNRLSVKLNH